MVEKDITVGMRVRDEDGAEGNVVEVNGNTVIVALPESGSLGLRLPDLDAKLGRKAKYWTYNASELSPVVDSGWILGAWYDWNRYGSDPKYRFQQIVEIDERGFGYVTMFPPHTEDDFAPYPFDKCPRCRISGPCPIGVSPWDDVAKVAKESVPEPTPEAPESTPDVSGDYSKADMKRLLETAAKFCSDISPRTVCRETRCSDCAASTGYHAGKSCNDTKGGTTDNTNGWPAIRAWFAEFIRVYGGEGTGPTPIEIVYDSIELDRIYSKGIVPKDTASSRLALDSEPFTKVSYRPLLRCGVHIDEDE